MSDLKYTDIVFDGPPGPEAGRFVEVENENGVSFSLGEWIARNDGYWALRIPDIEAKDHQMVLLTEAIDRHVVQIQALKADNERLRAALERIEQWCKAYPRTVFIEPTKEQWAAAKNVLKIGNDCPSLSAISGSNMRHVVEGIQALAAVEGLG